MVLAVLVHFLEIHEKFWELVLLITKYKYNYKY